MTNLILTFTNQITGDIYSGVVSLPDATDSYWKGIAFMFAFGIAMLGARWVRQIIGGTHESD